MAALRTADHVESVDDLHAAGGIRKRLVFALVDEDGTIEWLSVGRLTP